MHVLAMSILLSAPVPAQRLEMDVVVVLPTSTIQLRDPLHVVVKVNSTSKSDQVLATPICTSWDTLVIEGRRPTEREFHKIPSLNQGDGKNVIDCTFSLDGSTISNTFVFKPKAELVQVVKLYDLSPYEKESRFDVAGTWELRAKVAYGKLSVVSKSVTIEVKERDKAGTKAMIEHQKYIRASYYGGKQDYSAKTLAPILEDLGDSYAGLLVRAGAMKSGLRTARTAAEIRAVLDGVSTIDTGKRDLLRQILFNECVSILSSCRGLDHTWEALKRVEFETDETIRIRQRVKTEWIDRPKGK